MKAALYISHDPSAEQLIGDGDAAPPSFFEGKLVLSGSFPRQQCT